MGRFRKTVLGLSISAALSLTFAPLVAQQLSELAHEISIERHLNSTASSRVPGSKPRHRRDVGQVVEARVLRAEAGSDEAAGQIVLSKTSDGTFVADVEGDSFRPPRPFGQDARHFSVGSATRILVDVKSGTYRAIRLTGTSEDDRRTTEYLRSKGVDVDARRARIGLAPARFDATSHQPPPPKRLPGLRQPSRPHSPMYAAPRLQLASMRSGGYQCSGYGLNSVDGLDPIGLHLSRTYSWASFDDYFDYEGGWYSTNSDAYWYDWWAVPTSAGTNWYYDYELSWIDGYADDWGAGVEQAAFFYNWDFGDPYQASYLGVYNQVYAGEGWGWSDQVMGVGGEYYWLLGFDLTRAFDGWCSYW